MSRSQRKYLLFVDGDAWMVPEHWNVALVDEDVLLGLYGGQHYSGDVPHEDSLKALLQRAIGEDVEMEVHYDIADVLDSD